jgi:hypothetical protein
MGGGGYYLNMREMFQKRPSNLSTRNMLWKYVTELQPVFCFVSEEGGSSSQHALQLINIHNHDFSQC